MTKKIEEKAREAYFANTTNFASSLDLYTGGYRNGFLAALSEVRRAMADEPNNLQKIGAIFKLIKEADNG